MKKKIKDLTYLKVIEICNKAKGICRKCKLKGNGFYCIRERNLASKNDFDNYLEKEVEIDE